MSTYDRIKEQRTLRKKRLAKRMAIFVVMVSFAVGTYFFLHQPWLAFGSVYVTGLEKISREEVLFLTGLKEPVNLFVLEKKEIQHVLDSDLRVKKASVSYELPNLLHIDIVEEQPLFYVMSDYGFVSVNASGQVIAAGKNVKDAGAIIVSGLSAGNVFVGDQVVDGKLNYVLQFLNNLDSTVRNELSEFNVDKNSRARIIDLSGRIYILGETNNVEKKSADFSAILKEILKKNIAVEFVDLSYSKPYIKIKKQSLAEKQ